MQSASKSILPLEARNLRFEVGGVRLIKDLNFTLSAGPRTAIVGANGAGKSLLLRLCHGLIRPTAGEVVWGGSADGNPARHQAMVFQRPVMLRRSAAENIDHALRLRRLPRAARRALVLEALKNTKLHRLADRPARVLSFGEQQRLAIARAWALRPNVLFLDEPTASLDPSVTRTIEDLIDAIHQSGTKIIMATHDLGQVRRLADEVLFLHRGRLLEQTSVEQLFSGAKSDAARAFIAGDLFW